MQPISRREMLSRAAVLGIAAVVATAGCIGVNEGVARDGGAGTLAVQLTSLSGMEGNQRDARIYVDGRFVGNYEPEGTELALTAGTHLITVEVPKVYARRELPNGHIEVHTYRLRGEERLVVLGRGSKQSVVFSDQNLQSKEIENGSGH